VKGIHRPSPHPPRWGYDVVRAAYRLPAEAKHVWRIINEFDTSSGCWASRALLGQLTGIPCDRFAQYVGCLVSAGLIATVTTTGGLTVLFAALPEDFPRDATFERQDKLHWAGELDRRLLSLKTPWPSLLDSTAESSTAVPLRGSPAVTAVPSGGTPPNHNGGQPEKGAP